MMPMPVTQLYRGRWLASVRWWSIREWSTASPASRKLAPVMERQRRTDQSTPNTIPNLGHCKRSLRECRRTCRRPSARYERERTETSLIRTCRPVTVRVL